MSLIITKQSIPNLFERFLNNKSMVLDLHYNIYRNMKEVSTIIFKISDD